MRFGGCEKAPSTARFLGEIGVGTPTGGIPLKEPQRAQHRVRW